MALQQAVQVGRDTLVKKGITKAIATLELQTQAEDIWFDANHANELFAKLKGLKAQWEPIETLYTSVQELAELSADIPAEEQNMFATELQELQTIWQTVETSLYLGGEFDAGNCYVTISSGAGGTEAQDWAAMLTRMYTRFFEEKGWSAEINEKTDGAEAGIKSITLHVTGPMAYGHMRCERGTHRLVRQSPFNAKNLRQTSFALVEVLPEITTDAVIEINPSDLRVDTYRSSGAGGQHINKTDSAVRITHEPTGIVVACQSDRSQQKNRTNAMNMLRAKLLEKQRTEAEAKQEQRRGATQSADFGQQIRSYVLHPYKMVKDVRTNVETSNTEAVLDGALQEFIDAELKRSAGEE